MGYELLKALVMLLRGEGISAGEAYPGTGAPAVDGPQAAVGLLELDVPAGLASFQVRVLSPRKSLTQAIRELRPQESTAICFLITFY